MKFLYYERGTGYTFRTLSLMDVTKVCQLNSCGNSTHGNHVIIK